jgi:general secretion pathway protein F
VAEFRYVALKANGEKLRGRTDAPDAAAVARELRKEGLRLLSASEAGRWTRLADFALPELGRRPSLSREEIALVMRELATMLSAGESLDRSLRYMREGAGSTRVQAVLDAVREKLRHGAPLATALQEPPASLPRLLVSLVRAGEASGALAETIARLAELVENDIALRSTVGSALIYPALLLTVATVTIGLMVGFVLPQFVPIFTENGVAIPAATQFLLDASAFLSTAWPWLLGLALLVGLGIRAALAEPATRRRVDGALLRLPQIGALLKEIEAARFCRTLGIMVGNGMPLIAALDVVRDTLGNQAVAAAVGEATEVARGGGSLAKPLAAAKVFPRRAAQLIRLGEETGRLAPVMLQAAAIHEQRVRTAVQRLVGLLVPVITLGLGLAVAGIIASLMVSLMSLNDLAG